MSQHMDALERANIVRTARATLKYEIRHKEKTVIGVLKSPPPYIENMTIMELLTSQKSWGRTRARKLIGPLLINENKQIGSLTTRQREQLIQAICH